jgi:hypothetical protein
MHRGYNLSGTTEDKKRKQSPLNAWPRGPDRSGDIKAQRTSDRGRTGQKRHGGLSRLGIIQSSAISDPRTESGISISN